MADRRTKIGIKQVIQLEWLEKTLDLLKVGLTEKQIREELVLYLQKNRKVKKREIKSSQTRDFVIINLMKIWINPDKVLTEYRNSVLEFSFKEKAMAFHWAMISSTYPFWYNIAHYMGRLFNLQEEITKKQIVTRLKEQYGDRQTISRYADYVINSFVEWGVIKQIQNKGIYSKAENEVISNPQIAVILLESILNASSKESFEFYSLLNSPALFPYKLPDINLYQIESNSNRIIVNHSGGGNYFLSLNLRRTLFHK